MPIMTVGQITITEIYDLPALNAYISASQPSAQTYNNTAQTYSPAYSTTPQVLTLGLTKAGSTTSLIGADVSGVKWYKIIGGVKTEITSTLNTDTEYKSGTSNSVLTTKANIPPANNAVRYSVEGVYTDPISLQKGAFSAEIDLILVQLAKAAVIGNIYAPNGDFFRNGTPASLLINADLYKEGTLSAGSKKIKWFAADSSVTTSQDADGGIGWRKITVTTGPANEVVNVGFDIATTGHGVLTVSPAAVSNGQTYKCVITDNAGGTAGTKVTLYQTLMDMDDPVMVVVDSTGGNIIKNGSGSTTLTARVYRNGEEIDAAGSTLTYKWSKWQANVMAPNFGGAGIAYKTGKTLVVSDTDVDSVTMFKIEVTG